MPRIPKPRTAADALLRMDDAVARASAATAAARERSAAIRLERERELVRRGGAAETTGDSGVAAGRE